MLPSDPDLHAQITNALTELIRRDLQRAASEQRAPCRGADSSDELITEALARAEKLRTLRADFEVITTGAVLDVGRI